LMIMMMMIYRRCINIIQEGMHTIELYACVHGHFSSCSSILNFFVCFLL